MMGRFIPLQIPVPRSNPWSVVSSVYVHSINRVLVFSLFIWNYHFCFKNLLDIWVPRTKYSRILFTIGAGNKYLRKRTKKSAINSTNRTNKHLLSIISGYCNFQSTILTLIDSNAVQQYIYKHRKDIAR